jgi:hypothetical protein
MAGHGGQRLSITTQQRRTKLRMCIHINIKSLGTHAGICYTLIFSIILQSNRDKKLTHSLCLIWRVGRISLSFGEQGESLSFGELGQSLITKKTITIRPIKNAIFVLHNIQGTLIILA